HGLERASTIGFQGLERASTPFIPNCGSVAMVSSGPRPSDLRVLSGPRPPSSRTAVR
ncbi:unnamed protein product, partial [Musa textilis]